MTISEMAKRLEVSPHTLRYYEKIGLIREVDRAGARRSYTRQDQTWLEFILRLKGTGMPLKQIQQYAELRYEGDTTLTERKEMLLLHRQDLMRNIDKLKSHLTSLDDKIDVYETMEKEYDALRKRIEEAGGN